MAEQMTKSRYHTTRIAKLEAERDEAHKRVAELEDGLGPCGCGPGRCEQEPEKGAVYYGRLCRVARLLQPKTEPNPSNNL